MQEIRNSNPPVVTGICDPNNARVWHHCRINMCFEIDISVIVKHVQSIGIIRAFCLPGGQKKLLGCGLLGGISTQVDTMLSNELNFSVAVYIYKIHVFDGAFPLNIPF